MVLLQAEKANINPDKRSAEQNLLLKQDSDLASLPSSRRPSKTAHLKVSSASVPSEAVAIVRMLGV